MSIDTASKRRSVAGILTGLVLVGVTPAASPGVAWRQSAGWGYEGIAASTETAGEVAAFIAAGILSDPVRHGVLCDPSRPGVFQQFASRPGVL